MTPSKCIIIAIISLLITVQWVSSAIVWNSSQWQPSRPRRESPIVKVANDISYDEEEVTTELSVETTHNADTPIIPGNDLLIGTCTDRDQRVYTDNTAVENYGPSILNGTLEVS